MLEDIVAYLPVSDRVVTAGQPTADDLRAIAAAGFDVVINLGVSDAPYALPDERQIVEALGLRYHHIAVAWEGPTRADLEAFVATMEAEQASQVFVHCAVNKRVSVFMALYRILAQGRAPEPALADIRRIWEPNPVWQQLIDQQLAELRRMRPPYGGAS